MPYERRPLASHAPCMRLTVLSCAADRSALILSNIREAVILTDTEGRITDWNEGATRLYGWTAEEMVGRHYADRYPEPKRSFIAAGIQERLNGSEWDGEYEDIRKDGTPVWIDARVRRMLDAEGRVVGILGVSHDITARKRAEQAVLENAARLELALNASRMGVWELDAESGAISWSSGGGDLFGAHVGHITYPEILRMTHPEDQAAMQEAFDRAIHEGGVFEGECRIIQPGGEVRWISTRAQAYARDGGKPARVVGTVQDITGRKLAESRMQSLEKQQRSILDNLFAPVVLMAVDGTVLWVNKAVQDITGWPAEGFLGRKGWEALSSADPRAGELLEQGCERAVNGMPSRFDVQVNTAGGGPRTLDVQTAPVLDAAGNLEYILGSAVDITARKQAESAIVWQNRVLSRIATGAPVREVLEDVVNFVESRIPGGVSSVFLVDQESRRLRLAAGPRLPRALADVFDEVEVADSACRCGRTVQPCEKIHTTDIASHQLWGKHSELVLSHGLRCCWCVPIFDGGAQSGHGQTSRMHGVLMTLGERPEEPSAGTVELLSAATRLAGLVIERDSVLDERKRVEEALLQAQAVAHVGDWTYDVAARVLTGSEEANRICGWGPGPHFDDELVALIHPTDRARIEEVWKASLAGAPYDMEHRIVVGGKTKWVEVHARHKIDAGGRLRQIVGVIQDVTARTQLEEQLRHSQKMEAVGQLAGGIAHDFNNLLTVINGFTGLILDGLPPGDPLQADLAEISRAGERAATLTAQLLAFSRKTIIEPKVLDLNDLTEATGKMLRRLIGEDIALVTRFDPGIGKVRIDPGQFEQVLLNLSINARDAMSAGGRLTIETEDVRISPDIVQEYAQIRPGRYVQLSVTDTGSGMSDEVKTRIFEPFFTTKGVGQGTGLGLATVYGIVQQAGGRISVESEPGRGSRFRLLLPVFEEPTSWTSDAARAAPRGAETILLAEDEAGVRRLARAALEMQGYTVIEASSADEAIQKARRHPGSIHLLLTDVVMPGLGGRVLADTLHAQRPGIKVLYMSGYMDDAVVRHGVKAANDAFLQKPFTRLSLARKVRDVLDVGR